MSHESIAEPRRPGEDVYDYARRVGAASGCRGGDWRENPHRPGTREYYEFGDGQDQGRKDGES